MRAPEEVREPRGQLVLADRLDHRLLGRSRARRLAGGCPARAGRESWATPGSPAPRAESPARTARPRPSPSRRAPRVARAPSQSPDGGRPGSRTAPGSRGRRRRIRPAKTARGIRSVGATPAAPCPGYSDPPDRACGDRLGRGHVSFHQERRHPQHVAHVVEAVTDVSLGKSSAGRKSTPSRSRIVLLYSVRLRRRTVTRPGLPGLPQSSRASPSLIAARTRATSARAGCTAVLGRHDPALDVLADPLPRPAACAEGRLFAQGLEVEPALGVLRSVAARAVPREEWQHGPPEVHTVRRRGSRPRVFARGRLAGDPPRRRRRHYGAGEREPKESSVTTHPCLVVKFLCPISSREF